MSYLLGIDFGLKRIGISIGQTITNEARSLGGLTTEPNDLFWKQFDILVKRWDPKSLVFGKPLDKQGQMQPIMYSVFEFIQQCLKRYKLTAYWIDERYTTVMAKSDLNWKYSQQKNRIELDGHAAKLILTDWLELKDEKKEESIVPNSIT